MDSLFLSECVDCGDSLSVSVRDMCGSNDAVIPAATSLIPSRRLMWLSEPLAEVRGTSFSFMQVSPAVCARAASDTAGAPRCDLLDQPGIPVGITEGEERAVARALGVRAGKTCLRRKWGAVPHVTRADATTGDFLMCRTDVGDNQCAHGRTRRRRSHSDAEVNRATRARGRELDDANVLCRGDILVEPPSQALVELLRSFHVGHGDDVDLEVHGDFRYAGVRLLLFHGGSYWLRLPNETP